MADVAKAAGVHQTTVSLALRNQGRISEATRRRIRELAEKMGYRPNPLVSALIAGRRRGTMRGKGAGLAFLTTGKTRAQWRESPQYLALFDALRVHAEKRGYVLSEFWLSEPGMTPTRARRILLSRGIRGVVVCPLSGNRHQLDFDFSEFAAVSLGLTLHEPALDRVAGDYFSLMKQALARLLGAGFERIGFVTESAISERVGHVSLAAYLAERHLSPARVLPPCVMARGETAEVRAWLRGQKPDVVIVPTQASFNAMRTLLRDVGLRVPEDVSLVSLDCHAGGFTGGMVRDLEAEARAAVEWLTARVERAGFGVPMNPQTILVRGGWRDGASVRMRAPN